MALVPRIKATMVEDGAITSTKLADSSITSTKLADNAVTTTKILNNAVDNNKLANASISTAKLDSLMEDYVIGAVSSPPSVLPANETALTWAHGLPDYPSRYRVDLFCLNAQHGYSSGDRIDISTMIDGDGARHTGTWQNGTVVGFISAVIQTGFVVKRRDGAGVAIITPANWRIIFRVWK